MKSGFAFLACLLLLVAGCGRKQARHVRSGAMGPPAFWVWHRNSAPTPAETNALVRSGVRQLYWQVAECSWTSADWRMKPIAPPRAQTPGIERIPVFRLDPESAFLGAPEAAGSLGRRIQAWSRGFDTPRTIQLDFDCPMRLLDKYALFLQSLAKQLGPTEISITALASWPQSPDFMNLARSVSSLAPMFYDLEEDRPADVRAGRFHPMADRSAVQWIALWRDCPRPWLAGLPNFERVSLFTENGDLTGHVRAWDHDAVLFDAALQPRDQGNGVIVCESAAAVVTGNLRIPPRGKLVYRRPDEASLAVLAKAADEAGAAGLIYFALPGPGIRAGYSVAHLTHPGAVATPEVRRLADGRIVLKNAGPADLPPRVWELELSAGQAGAFRSASPGAFARTDSPGGMPAEMAGSIVLRFSRLGGGESLVSGPLLAKPDSVDWKIRGLTENRPLIPDDSAR